MAVWSEVRLRDLRGASRLDAEFWQPAFLDAERAIQRHEVATLEDLSDSIRKGVFYILAEDYVSEGVPFYRSANVGEVLPRESDLVYITEKRDRAEHATSLASGDLMIAKTARAGAAVVMRARSNISQDVIGVRVKRDRVNPFYLAAFLNTQAGQSQMRRWFQGQVQGHLSLPDVRDIAIPLLAPEFQKQIGMTVLEAHAARANAEELYQIAELRLAEALGIADLPGTGARSFVRQASEAQASLRLDAEYFSPRYQHLLAVLRGSGLLLADVGKISRRRFRPSEMGLFSYIEIGDVTKRGTAEASEVEMTEAPSRAQWIVRPGDVLTTLVRPIRRLSALISDLQNGFVCSSGFAVLTPQEVAPELLLLFLRLPIIAELLDLHTTASMYPAIAPDVLMAMPVALPSSEIGAELAALVKTSLDEGDRASELLRDAVRAVDDRVLNG
jgi:restriction endonuclease S subunit